jgi:TPR repeat protein
LFFTKAREAAKSGLELFYDGIEKINIWQLEETFERFERAAAKGHEESIWIKSVVKDAKMNWTDLKKAFVKTEVPLGYYLAGRLLDGREKFDFDTKSAEGVCSWGQVGYGDNFYGGDLVEEDIEVHVEWLEKAAGQNNPLAIDKLGYWFQEEEWG